MDINRVQIVLPADLMRFATSLIDGKRYFDLSDVVLEALSRFREQKEFEAWRLERLRAEIQKGIDSADRGELVDGDEFLEKLLADLEAEPVPIIRPGPAGPGAPGAVGSTPRDETEIVRRARERTEVEEAFDREYAEDDWFSFVDRAEERGFLNALPDCLKNPLTPPD